jgi:hypothetical protein
MADQEPRELCFDHDDPADLDVGLSRCEASGWIDYDELLERRRATRARSYLGYRRTPVDDYEREKP